MKNYLDKIASLTPAAKKIILHHATEHPFSGEYDKSPAQGTYLCRRCGLFLFRGANQFHAGCGWPSFDVASNNLEETEEADRRIEIHCNRCQAHGGHVFYNEQFTATNTRYCINCASIDFVTDDTVFDTNEAIVAGGCFWGIAHFLQLLPGVLLAEAGYTGGHLQNPTYRDVCQGDTGHFEAVRIIYDLAKTDYYSVLKRFFEIHDPGQANGQGPDIGLQYQSAIFYYNEDQLQTAQQLIQTLNNRHVAVATALKEVHPFWPAEEYHQNYYSKNKKSPYCHRFSPRFG